MVFRNLLAGLVVAAASLATLDAASAFDESKYPPPYGRAAFYCYAYPEPASFAAARLKTPGAFYDASQTAAAAQQPGGNQSARVIGRSCQNCHSQIHGSNHPSGARFQR